MVLAPPPVSGLLPPERVPLNLRPLDGVAAEPFVLFALRVVTDPFDLEAESLQLRGVRLIMTLNETLDPHVSRKVKSPCRLALALNPLLNLNHGGDFV
jgi:hypothetical protein